MRRWSASPAAFLVLLASLLLAPCAGEELHTPDFDSAKQKFAWIAKNGESTTPSTEATVLTAAEWNAYLNEGGVKLPEGLSAIHISSEPGTANADVEVDFDRLTANRTRGNPLLLLFTGKHRVTATARVSAADGIGSVHVQSVQFDGMEIPRIALEYFASRYLRPKYGAAAGLDSTFPLHHRIDTAMVETDRVSIAQR